MYLFTEVIPDGVSFPGTPEAFQEELLRQAQELHYEHGGLPLDLSRLRAPVHPGDPTDDPDFISRMRAALPRPPELPVAGVRLGYQGHACQFGLLHARESSVRRVLASRYEAWTVPIVPDLTPPFSS